MQLGAADARNGSRRRTGRRPSRRGQAELGDGHRPVLLPSRARLRDDGPSCADLAITPLSVLRAGTGAGAVLDLQEIGIAHAGARLQFRKLSALIAGSCMVCTIVRSRAKVEQGHNVPHER